MTLRGGETSETSGSGVRTILQAFRRCAAVAQPAVLACALLLATNLAARAEPDSGAAATADTAPTTEQSLQDLLLAKPHGAAVAPAAQDQLLAFYAARDFKPAWSGSSSAASRAEAVRSVLEHADAQGLRSGDYMSALSQWDSAPEDGADAAKYDLAMTAALLRYARDVRIGRIDPGGVYKDVRLPKQDFDPAAALGAALKHRSIDEFLEELPPQQQDYQNLVAALAAYREIDAEGGWPTLSTKSGIALDGSDPKRAALLIKRLAFEDPALATNLEPSMADLREAVLRYQRRNGLNDDGKAGPEMLKMLNIPASYRVQQIVANMERWRWMPRAFERRYVAINVPDQSLDFIRNGEVALHSRVVIGRKDNQTPILRAMVLAVIANPPWNIPDDIVAKSILPKLRQSPDYLASRNMVLANGPADDPQGINVDWSNVSAKDIPYQFQQSPGGDNALGSLMLDMPNDFDVYMHDTPNKKLFVSDMREISHGCIRVQEIFPLASLALTGGSDDNSDDITQAIATGETQRLQLSEPVPVYLLYWTAIASSDGAAGFRPDLYDRDRMLIAKLGSPAKPRRVAHSDDAHHAGNS